MIKSIIYCFLYAVFNVSGAAIIKWKLKGRLLSTFNDWLNLLFDSRIISAFVLLFCSALILFRALSSGNFSLIIPISVGINFILTVIVGYYLFRDAINIISLAGFILIISGIILLSLNTANHAK